MRISDWSSDVCSADLSHRSDFPERDQAHDACKLNDLQQRFVFKCRLDEIAYESSAHLVDAAVRIAVHWCPSLFLNVRQELVFERRMLFQRLDELPYLGLDLVIFHELLDLLVGRAVVIRRHSNEAYELAAHQREGTGETARIDEGEHARGMFEGPRIDLSRHGMRVDA